MGLRFVLALTALAGIATAAPVAAQTAADQKVTYSKDIAPILQRSCQRCHKPDSVAPMSLLTYQEVRPYAREIKRRTQLRYGPYSRGAMPPWFVETNIGIQKFRDDVSLSDKEIALIAKWADSGAPEGDPKDAPPPLKFADAATWTLGKPDLIISSPTIYIGDVASDWGGSLGKTPLGLTENRYAASSEFHEVSDKKFQGGTIGGRFVFHHANVGILGPDDIPDGESAGEAGGFGNRLPIHEVGRNGDAFPPEAGKLLPARGFLGWDSMHVHSAGAPGSARNARLDIGLVLHPVGYKPKYDFRAYTFGRTEIQVEPGGGLQREDAYYITPQAMKLINYEPHMHANGVRMCLEAVYGRVVETLNCAGYDHNWVRNYQYEPNYEPIIPKGSIIHAISWFDNTPKNTNVIDPRNLATFGNSSVNNMLIVFNLAQFLSDEEYTAEIAKRKEFLASHPDVENIGCPACYLPLPKQPQVTGGPQAAPQPPAGGN
jgi:hypothetical protein